MKMNENNQPVQIESGNECRTDIKSSGNNKTMSRLAVISSTLAILFFVGTVVFVALFTYTYVKHVGRDPASGAICSPLDCATPAPPTDTVCNTPECVTIAARMISKMNVSADPCEDFNEFACGRYIRETLIPDGEWGAGSFYDLSGDNLVLIKGLITEEIRRGEPSYLTRMKLEYTKCMLTEKSIPSDFLREFAKTWPTLNANWTGNTFNLSTAISSYFQIFVAPFYTIYRHSDDMDSSKEMYYVYLPELGLKKGYYMQPRNDPTIMAYQKYLSEVAVALGALRDVAERDAKDVVDLEIALSQILPNLEEQLNEAKLYNPMTLKEISTRYPELGITQILRDIGREINVPMRDNTIAVVLYPSFIGNIAQVIKHFSNRTLQNIFAFHEAVMFTQGINTGRLEAIYLAYQKVLWGITGNIPKWSRCAQNIAQVYSTYIEQELLARNLSSGTTKIDIKEIFNHIKETFKQMVVENTWLSQATKEEVYKKVAGIRLTINQEEYQVQEEDIKQMISQRFALSDENDLTIQTQKGKLNGSTDFLKVFRRLRNKSQLGTEVYFPNARYHFDKNTIDMSNSILQPRFFSKNYPDYINYGAIGTIIAHEITHGFDYRGALFDEKGNLRNWWQPSDKDKFHQRLQCIIDQTSGFYVEEIKMNLNGFSTQTECVADTSGLKSSFRAYKAKVSKKGEEARLPGLNLTPDQLFFLSFGQVWCAKMTKELKIYQVYADEHIVEKYRIIGAAQNSEDFAKAYNCPRGSYMNPEKKCDVW